MAKNIMPSKIVRSIFTISPGPKKSTLQKVAAERQLALGLPLDPIHPDILKLTLSPTLVTVATCAISENDQKYYPTIKITDYAVVRAVKETIFINDEDNKVWISRFSLDLMPDLPRYICGFIEHLDEDLQAWRKI